MTKKHNFSVKLISVLMVVLLFTSPVSPLIVVLANDSSPEPETNTSTPSVLDATDENENTTPDEDNELVGDIITLDNGLRIRLNADEKSYTVVDYVGGKETVDIPSHYYGLPITRIGDVVFYGNTTAKKIIIPSTVSFVGEHAFTNLGDGFEYNVINNGRYLGNADNPYLYFVAPVNENVT